MNTAIIKTGTRVLCKAGLTIKKYSPEICMGLGVVAGGASIFGFVHQTLKADEVLDEHRRKMDDINEAFEAPDVNYDENDRKKDRTLTYAQTGVGFAKLYSWPTALAITSVGCFFGAFGILRARNVLLSTSLEAFMAECDTLRKKLQERNDVAGKDVIDMEEVERTYIPATETEPAKEVIKYAPKTEAEKFKSMYSRIFDPLNSMYRQYDGNPSLIRQFLIGAQNMFNDRLKARGYVFLSEVYEHLGFEDVGYAHLVGWVYDPTSTDGDNYISFGLDDYDDERIRAFLLSAEEGVLLDFNVQGRIWDKI